MRRFLLLLITVFLVVAAAAQAAPSRKKAIWGPITVDGVSQFPIYHDLGVGIWQYTVHWDQVAPQRPADASDPQDPAYQWPPELDFAIRQANRYGIKVSLMLIGAPSWANGGKA